MRKEELKMELEKVIRTSHSILTSLMKKADEVYTHLRDIDEKIKSARSYFLMEAKEFPLKVDILHTADKILSLLDMSRFFLKNYMQTLVETTYLLTKDDPFYASFLFDEYDKHLKDALKIDDSEFLDLYGKLYGFLSIASLDIREDVREKLENVLKEPYKFGEDFIKGVAFSLDALGYRPSLQVQAELFSYFLSCTPETKEKIFPLIKEKVAELTPQERELIVNQLKNSKVSKDLIDSFLEIKNSSSLEMNI